MRKLSIAIALIASLFAAPAYADFTGKDAAAATITFFNTGTCTSVVCKPQNQLIDSAGSEILGLVTASPAANTIGARLVTINTSLGTINTTLGTPLQAGGTVVLTAETTKVIGTVRIASGGVASGAIAAGAYAVGSIVDGAYLTDGAIADAAVAAGATGSNSAKLRRLTTDIDAIKTSAASIDTKASLALPAQTGIGNVNIGAVQSAGSAYKTVAASATATVLGATGATGDYLSHCVIYPASTSPGVVTVFDNANAAATNVIAFAGGASSTSNLTPISVPVGALSTAGAWKVTTGANVSVACFGKFT